MSEVEQRFTRLLAENKNIRDMNRKLLDQLEQYEGGGSPPGGSPHDPGMEARVARLEEALPRIEKRLDTVDAGLRTIEQSVTTVDGRLDALTGIDVRIRDVERGMTGLNHKLDILSDKVLGKIPSIWQIPGVIGATAVLLGALAKAAQYLHLLDLHPSP